MKRLFTCTIIIFGIILVQTSELLLCTEICQTLLSGRATYVRINKHCVCKPDLIDVKQNYFHYEPNVALQSLIDTSTTVRSGSVYYEPVESYIPTNSKTGLHNIDQNQNSEPLTSFVHFDSNTKQFRKIRSRRNMSQERSNKNDEAIYSEIDIFPFKPYFSTKAEPVLHKLDQIKSFYKKIDPIKSFEYLKPNAKRFRKNYSNSTKPFTMKSLSQVQYNNNSVQLYEGDKPAGYLDIDVYYPEVRDNLTNNIKNEQETKKDLIDCFDLYIVGFAIGNYTDLGEPSNIQKYAILSNVDLRNEIQAKCNKTANIMQQSLQEILDKRPKMAKLKNDETNLTDKDILRRMLVDNPMNFDKYKQSNEISINSNAVKSSGINFTSLKEHEGTFLLELSSTSLDQIQTLGSTITQQGTVSEDNVQKYNNTNFIDTTATIGYETNQNQNHEVTASYLIFPSELEIQDDNSVNTTEISTMPYENTENLLNNTGNVIDLKEPNNVNNEHIFISNNVITNNSTGNNMDVYIDIRYDEEETLDMDNVTYYENNILNRKEHGQNSFDNAVETTTVFNKYTATSDILETTGYDKYDLVNDLSNTDEDTDKNLTDFSTPNTIYNSSKFNSLKYEFIGRTNAILSIENENTENYYETNYILANTVGETSRLKVVKEVDEFKDITKDFNLEKDSSTTATTVTFDNHVTVNTIPKNINNISNFMSTNMSFSNELRNTTDKYDLNASDIIGQMYFLYNHNNIPARFVQKPSGEIQLGIDGNYLCDKLVKVSSQGSLLLKALCKL